MLRTLIRWFFLIAFLIFLGWSIYIAALAAVHFAISLNQPLLVAAILAASSTILAATITVVVGRIFERKREIESHFRGQKYEQYDELLKIIHGFIAQSGPLAESGRKNSEPDDRVVKQLAEWQWRLILFAGPGTIRSFVAWMSHLKSDVPRIKTILLMEAFFKSLRKDLGISNLGLRDGDFAHLILRHGELFVAMAKKNPDMPLNELSELEKIIGNKPALTVPLKTSPEGEEKTIPPISKAST
jgi:hypothetical protein